MESKFSREGTVNPEGQIKTVAYYYSKFRIALSEKQFDEAKKYFQIFQFFKRRMRLDQFLNEICDVMEKENSK